MKPPLPRRERTRRVLRFLRMLEQHHAGYVLRGVHGWAMTPDIEARIGTAVPELLPALARAGLVDREDVRVAGSPRPTWAYRLTSRGLRRFFAMQGWPYEHEQDRLDEPGRPGPHVPASAHVPPECLRLLEELRRAADDPSTPTPVPGEPGWLTVRQLRDLVLTGWSDVHLVWLLRRGLLERRHPAGAGATRRDGYLLFRITPAARVLRPLRWREPVGADTETGG